MNKKKNLLIYSGHNELIGGDAHFVFNLISNLNLNEFDIELYTDNNYLFKKRAAAWLKVDIPIYYLNTRPILFYEYWLDQFHKKIKTEHSSPFRMTVYKLFQIKLFEREIYFYFRKLTTLISFKRISGHISNFGVFFKLFKSKKDQIDIFFFNNGGYPAKEAGLIAILMAKFFKIKNIIMKFNNVPQKKRLLKPMEYMYDFLIPKFCNKIISDSDMTGSVLTELRKFPKEKIITIRDGLEDVGLLDEQMILSIKTKLNIPLDCPLLIVSGNLEEIRKGHEPLFHSIKLVKEKIPDVLLIVVGNASRARVKYLKNLRDKLGLQNNILFLGYRTDIYKLNSISDVVLTPSVGVESIPFTIIEGARLAKPIITTTVGGCPEAVINNVTGFIVEPFNIEELANKIIILITNKELQKRMGKKSKEYFIERFLLKKSVKLYEEIFN